MFTLFYISRKTFFFLSFIYYFVLFCTVLAGLRTVVFIALSEKHSLYGAIAHFENLRLAASHTSYAIHYY